MVKDFFWIAIASSIVSGLLALAFWSGSNSGVVVVKYDCSMLIGGWHPDVPVKVQEECKKKELNK
jgi:hypothetical protein